METPGGTSRFKIFFEVKDKSLSGTVRRAAGDVPLNGTIAGNDVGFSYTVNYNGNELTLSVYATLKGDELSGTIDLGGGTEEPFAAKRVTAPAKPPRVR